MPRDFLDGYHKYDQAKIRRPESAMLARRLFEYCRTHHQVNGVPTTLNWPEGKQRWIVSEPNYFAFNAINVRATGVGLDLRPSNFNRFICPNGVTPEEAKAVNLKGRGANDNHAEMKIEREDQLAIAFKILDFAHRWVTR